MKKDLRILTALGLLFGLAWATPEMSRAADSVEATITVTPEALVALNLPTTTYAFGAVDVNTSTSSVTPLTLSNSGEVSVTVHKLITVESNPIAWTAATSIGIDQYILYAATATTRPGVSDFSAGTMFGALNNSTPLTGPLGNALAMPPEGTGSSVDIWFRLDMPSKVTSLIGRTITVRFTAAAQ